MTANGGACTMTMYYHMYGPSIGGLAVYTRTQVNGAMNRLWQRKTEAGNYFARVTVDLQMSTTATQVRL